MYPEAILFDMDDTILSDDIVSEEAWKEACDGFAEKVRAYGSGELFAHINTVRTAFWSETENISITRSKATPYQVRGKLW